MWQTLMFMFLIMGSIIGAGFSSGKEILVFFGEFSFLTPLSLILLFLCLFFALYFFAMIGKKNKPQSIQDINKIVFPKSHKIMDIAIVICMVLLLGAMLAGSDALGGQIFDNYNIKFIGLTTALIGIVFVSFGFTFFKIANFVLVIILIFLVDFIAMMGLVNPLNINFAFNDISFLLGAKSIIFPILYVSLNMVTESVLCAVGAVKLSKKQIVWGLIISCLILVGSIFIVLLSLTKNYSFSLNASLPMLALAQLLGGAFPILYGIVLWIAIFTSVLSSLYCSTQWLNQYFNNRFLSALTLASIAYFFSLIGFDLIVEYFYPLYGVVGAVFVIFAGIYFFNNIFRKKTVKY